MTAITKDECYSKKLAEEDELRSKWCHAIKNWCRDDCASFSKASWKKHGANEDKYYYYRARCTNPNVTGDLYIEVDGVNINY